MEDSGQSEPGVIVQSTDDWQQKENIEVRPKPEVKFDTPAPVKNSAPEKIEPKVKPPVTPQKLVTEPVRPYQSRKSKSPAKSETNGVVSLLTSDEDDIPLDAIPPDKGLKRRSENFEVGPFFTSTISILGVSA